MTYTKPVIVAMGNKFFRVVCAMCMLIAFAACGEEGGPEIGGINSSSLSAGAGASGDSLGSIGSGGSGSSASGASAGGTSREDAILLTVDTWANGSVTANGDQWFKFTATASTQYIHVDCESVYSVYAQMYDSSAAPVGSVGDLSPESDNHFMSRVVTVGNVYYIRLDFDGNETGTYTIAFNASSAPPPVALPSGGVTVLTANTWANGTIASAGGEQWFRFTATAPAQWIHIEYGTLSNIDIRVFDSHGTKVQIIDHPAPVVVTTGQQYYVRVFSYVDDGDLDGSGTYKIAFTTVPVPPGTPTLTANTWANGSGSAAEYSNLCFRFTATAEAQWIHVEATDDNSYVHVIDISGEYLNYNDSDDTGFNYRRRYALTVGQEYYVLLWGYLDSYKIAFNSSSVPPGTNAIPAFSGSDFNTWTAAGQASAISFAVDSSGELNVSPDWVAY